MTKYARDEFDRVPETSARQGVHRAVAASRRRSLAPILAAGCVALAIGLVAFLILPKLGFSAGQAAAVTAGGSASASASSSPSARTMRTSWRASAWALALSRKSNRSQHSTPSTL